MLQGTTDSAIFASVLSAVEPTVPAFQPNATVKIATTGAYPCNA